MATIRCCKTLAQRALLRHYSKSAPFSSSKLTDPAKLVLGLTPEKVAANPQIAEFLEANFGAQSDSRDDGFVIPQEVLKEYGIEYEVEGEELEEESTYGAPKVDLGLGSPEQQALNIRTLRTYVRKEEGTSACYRLRDERLIPGMLFGSNPKEGIFSVQKESKTMLQTSWTELQRELDRFHRRFESRVYDLTVFEDESDKEGTVHRVVPRDVQRHPVKDTIFCANFLRYHPGRPLKIPIVYINQEESPALKRDGFIVPINKYVECFVVEGVPIPEAVELECSGVQLKDVLRMDRIIFPDGVRHTDRVDVEKFIVGPVFGARSSGDETEKDDGEEEGGDEESGE